MVMKKEKMKNADLALILFSMGIVTGKIKIPTGRKGLLTQHHPRWSAFCTA